MKLSDIHIRDPFVMPVADQGLYYLYGTMGAYAWTDSAVGVDCYISTDLQTWHGPISVFRPPEGFWADRNFWAPEVFAWRGRFYMFISFKAPGACRGTQVLAADSPRGPFLPVSERPVTPAGWECLDGTFFVAEDGNPWMVFSHEWVQVGDGQIWALPLSENLSRAIGKPVQLFSASQAPWAELLISKNRWGYVTDGPWMHRLPNGELLLLWSSHGVGGYTVGIARTPSGKLTGPWIQDSTPLFGKDGGHCMTFHDFNGNCWLSLHQPDGHPNERPRFIPLDESRLATF